MPKILEDEQIYAAVMHVVAERGFAGATTKQMAEAANVSEVTLFRKYGSKAQMVKEAISFLIEKADFASVAQYTGDIHADLTRLVRAYQGAVAKNGLFFLAIFFEITRYPELVSSVNAPMNLFHSMGELITRYQDEGKLCRENPFHTLAALLAPVMFLNVMGENLLGEKQTVLDLEHHLQVFLDGRRI